MNNKEMFEEKTDEELIKLIHDGDNDALETLITRYESIVKKLSNNFFITGAEQSDVFQEGQIGLYSAIKNFKVENNAKFKTFAILCIKRKLITALKNSNRQKQVILNEAISLNASTGNGCEENPEMIEFIKDSVVKDPLDIIVDYEYQNAMKNAIYNKLSAKEKDVLNEYIKGKSYSEIATTLNCKEKSVDTALTRIRRKANEIQKDVNSKFLK